MTSEILSALISDAVDQALITNKKVITAEIMECFNGSENLEIAVSKMIPLSIRTSAEITTMLIIRTLEHQGSIQLPADGEAILWPLF